MAEVNDTITARRGHIQALAFARKGGAALGSLLFSIAKRKEEEGKGPIETVVFLLSHYSDEEGHAIPEVGSQEGKTGNRPYDRYTSTIKTADGDRKVPGSWFTDAVKATDEWDALNLRREHCKTGQGEGIPADIIAMSPGQRAMEIKRITDFIKNMRTGLTKGSMLLHQVEKVGALNPARIKVRLPVMQQKDKDGNEVTVVIGNLIRVTDPAGIVQEDEVLTVSQFLQWDVEKAGKAEDKGSITSLKATATRAPRKGTADKAGTGTAYTIPKTLEQTLTLFNCLASALDNGTDAGRMLESKLLSECAKEGPAGDEATVSVGKVCMAADNIWTVIQTRFNTIMAQKAAATKKAVA
jgi:hypothetical protein